MKIVSEKELKGYDQAVIKGGTKGFLGGLAVSIPASLIAQRRWPYYRALPPSIKALGIVTIVVPSFVIAAEQAGHAFERSQWTGIQKVESGVVKTVEQRPLDHVHIKGKIGEWASRNKWGIILGSWGVGMAGSFGIIMRDPYQTFPQKIVQARMWAQGLTVGIILASAVLSAQSRKPVDVHHPHSAPDHSWAAIVAKREKEQEASHTN